MADLTLDIPAIRKRAENCRTYNFGMRDADRLAHEDVFVLLTRVVEQQSEIQRIQAELDAKDPQ